MNAQRGPASRSAGRGRGHGQGRGSPLQPQQQSQQQQHYFAARNQQTDARSRGVGAVGRGGGGGGGGSVAPAPMMIVKDPDFLNKDGPVGYIAGIGRGAIGFVTRSDIGPTHTGFLQRASMDDDDGDVEVDGGGGGLRSRRRMRDETDSGMFRGNANEAEEEDDEADRIFQMVEDRVKASKRARTASKPGSNSNSNGNGNSSKSTIQSLFAEEKQQLTILSEADWMSIPDEALNTTRRSKNKENRNEERYSAAAADILLEKARSGLNAYSRDIDASAAGQAGLMDDSYNDNDNDNDSTTAGVGFEELRRARDTMFSLRLDQAASTTSSSSSKTASSTTTTAATLLFADPSSTSNDTMGPVELANKRLLLKSLIASNPENAAGWISAARLEESAGKLSKARKLINRACDQCPSSVDVWLAAGQLHDRDQASSIYERAIETLPQSERLWQAAIDLESSSVVAKKEKLRAALVAIPENEEWWMELASLEPDSTKATKLLSRAVELVSSSVKLWLKLSSLQPDADSAISILSRARESCPTDVSVWMASAKIIEHTDSRNTVGIRDAIDAAVTHLSAQEPWKSSSAVDNRRRWLELLGSSEYTNLPITRQFAVESVLRRYTPELSLQPVDSQAVADLWADDASWFIDSGSSSAAALLLDQATAMMPQLFELWRMRADIARSAFTARDDPEQCELHQILRRATDSNPSAVILWLIRAKDMWTLSGRADLACSILTQALCVNLGSEPLLIARAKINYDIGSVGDARRDLQQAVSSSASDRAWIKAACLERDEGNAAAALDLVTRGLEKHQASFKLHLMRIQLVLQNGDLPAARRCAQIATKQANGSASVWIHAAKLYLAPAASLPTQQNIPRARAILEEGKIACPNAAELWIESVHLDLYEMASKHVSSSRIFAVPPSSTSPLYVIDPNESSVSTSDLAAVRTTLTATLSRFPQSAYLHSLQVLLTNRHQRNTVLASSIAKLRNSAIATTATTATAAATTATTVTAQESDFSHGLLVTQGRWLWSSGDFDGARRCFEHATRLDPDDGDAWVWLYALEQHSNSGQSSVATATAAASSQQPPRHGYLWAAIAKASQNARKSFEERLRDCIVAISSDRVGTIPDAIIIRALS